jgi:hypothetical protein
VSSYPINTVAPFASGTPGVGNTLSCTQGTWTTGSRQFAGPWWTTPLASKTPVANSAAWISNLVANGVGGIFINTGAFASAWAAGQVGVTPGWAYGTVVAGDGSFVLDDVPLDASWVTPHAYNPSDTDNQFIITDLGTSISYEVGGDDPGLISGPNWNAGASSGGVRPFPLSDDGWVNQQTSMPAVIGQSTNPNGLACDAAGCSTLGGIMFPDEINAEAIEHRLFCAIPGDFIRGPSNSNGYPFPLQDTGAYINPATRSDGSAGQFSDSIPMGSVFTFPASFDITTLTSDPYLLAVLQAIKTYGMVVGNSGGGSAITLVAVNVCSPSAPTYPSSILGGLSGVTSQLVIVTPPPAPIYSS